jgi:hypothetical protein
MVISSLRVMAIVDASKDRVNEVAKSSYWKKLLHYEDGWFSSRSLADTDSFFISKRGSFDYTEELRATISAFQKVEKIYTPEKMPAQCAFPERFKFVEKSFPEIKFTRTSCPDLKKWKKAVIGDSVSLVFASSYVNNPSSMFGHTFLKFNQRDVTKLSDDMFNYVVAFSAKADENPGLLYAIKGLFGGYKGVVNVKPFYQTMREYSKIESRDLWEYKLDLSNKEIDSILNHLWELYANTNFDYYFFDENCTSVLARILDLVSSDDRYARNMRGYALPTELVKTLSKNNRITDVRYYPSLRKTFWAHYNSLSKEQKKDFSNIIHRDSSNGDAQTFQAVIHYYDYKRHDFENQISSEFNLKQKRVLSQASKKGQAQEISISSPASPHVGHLPARVGVLAGKKDGDTVSGLKFRPLFHGLSDNDKGHEPWSSIEFLKGELIYNHDKDTVLIENITLAEILSLPNFTSLDKNISWDLSLQVNPLIEDFKESSLKTSYSMKLGITKQEHRFVLSSLIGAKIEAHDSFVGKVRFGPHVKLLSGVSILNSKLILEGDYFHSFLGKGDLSDRFYIDYSLGLYIPVFDQGQIELKTKAHSRLGSFSDTFDTHCIGVNLYF